MQEIRSGNVPTLMLSVFMLVNTLISANVNGMQSTCVVNRFLKQVVVISTQERSFGMESMH